MTTLLSHESSTHLTENGIHSFTADVTKDEDVEALREKVTGITNGQLDVLVNNAGICKSFSRNCSSLMTTNQRY